MKFPEVKSYPDTGNELNLVDYQKFSRVRDLFSLIRQYDGFPLTPVILSSNGQVDLTKRYKQGDIKADWPLSWPQIIIEIKEVSPTIDEIVNYYKLAVRGKKITPGPEDMYPGDPYRFGDPYDDIFKQSQIFFVEFYKVYTKLEKWSELGMKLYSDEHELEIETQIAALKIQQLRTKKVVDMTGDDIIQLLELYDKYKD